ncbi:MAG: hypothetical protein LBB21_01355 [Holosporaceae bacterium]|jgi:hypothetical protein|nr:hypothetical protein [Holosporaceae bacterium]
MIKKESNWSFGKAIIVMVVMNLGLGCWIEEAWCAGGEKLKAILKKDGRIEEEVLRDLDILRLAWGTTNVGNALICELKSGHKVMLISGNDGGWSGNPSRLAGWKRVDALDEIEQKNIIDVGTVVASCQYPKDSRRQKKISDILRWLDRSSEWQIRIDLTGANSGMFIKGIREYIGSAKVYLVTLRKWAATKKDIRMNTGYDVGGNVTTRLVVTNANVIDKAIAFLDALKAIINNYTGAAATLEAEAAIKYLAGMHTSAIAPSAHACCAALKIDAEGLFAYKTCLHTEAQVEVISRLDFLKLAGKRLLSWKMPCWSCVRLPITAEKGMYAIDRGCNDGEWKNYPVKVLQINLIPGKGQEAEIVHNKKGNFALGHDIEHVFFN